MYNSYLESTFKAGCVHYDVQEIFVESTLHQAYRRKSESEHKINAEGPGAPVL